jgi:hypothetical protein
MKKILFLIAGHFFLALGLVGAILPILPTTPFLLLAVFFYSKSNSKLHSWLMNNKYFGHSEISSYEYVDISPTVAIDLFRTRPVYSIDFKKRQLNAEFSTSNVANARDFIESKYISKL